MREKIPTPLHGYCICYSFFIKLNFIPPIQNQ